MRFKLPIFGIDFIEKTINANFIKAFLDVFRETKDIHRVLIIIPLAVLISHSYYLKGTPHISVLTYTVRKDELIWVILEAFLILFVFSFGKCLIYASHTLLHNEVRLPCYISF